MVRVSWFAVRETRITNHEPREKNVRYPSSASEDDGRARRLGPSRHHEFASADPHRRQADAARHAAAHGAGDEAARVLGSDRRAEAPLRREPRARHFVRHQGAGPLPRQHLQSARRDRSGLPADSLRDPRVQGARPSVHRRGDLQPASRTGAGHRSDRLRQIDDARRDDRQDQPRAPRAHHHDRGSGRVPASTQELHRQSARAARRHALLRQLAQVRAASGPGRGADRRDARPRDDRVGAAHRRDGPPHLRHAAHELGGADHQPYRRRLPRAPAAADPRPALLRSGGHHVPGPCSRRRMARGA